MRVLVTGGTGYIGSHTVIQLVESGYEVVVVDSYINSKPTVAARIEAVTGKLLEVHGFDLCDEARTDALFADQQIDAVIHFAGLKAVGESVAKPVDYYANNLGSTFSLLKAMQRHNVRQLVFSSSATVYGATPVNPMTEDAPTSATNPYGWTKVMQEQILRDVAAADATWRIALLRYFNPVGAHPSGTLGEDPQGMPNNLVPFIAQVAVGRLKQLTVYGDDYPTSDGTAERDYIHVLDLAAGHVAALDRLGHSDLPVDTWNLGTGRPTTVLQMVASFSKAVGREIPYVIGPRRSGDIASSYADPAKAERELGWHATRTVDEMCADTWRWQSNNPQGYPDA